MAQMDEKERLRRLEKARLSGFGSGGHPRKYWFTYGMMAVLCGVKVETVANAKYRGEFEPTEFGSVVRWCAKRMK